MQRTRTIDLVAAIARKFNVLQGHIKNEMEMIEAGDIPSPLRV